MIVYTPVPGFHGAVAGVYFVNGQAEVDPASPALAYFRRKGYGVGMPPAKPWTPPAPAPRQPRSEMTESVAPRLTVVAGELVELEP